MAKKTSINLYPKEDAEAMWSLWKRIITMNDVDLIYRLYTKYVDSGAPYPVLGCSCHLSPSVYYDTLRDWHLKNNNLFET